MLFMDPPDHTRLRGLVARAFTPRHIEGLRSTTEAITKERSTGWRRVANQVDLIEAFAYPLPVRVICTLLGVPAVDEATFTGWSRGIARSLDPRILRPAEVDATDRGGPGRNGGHSASCSGAAPQVRATTFCPGWPPSTSTAIAWARAK